MPTEFTQLSSFQLETLPREKCVFFFPVGPLEDHGAHLPMGLDLAEAHQLCLLAAQHLEEEIPGWVGVVMPAAPLGLESNTTKVAVTVRPHVLRDWLVDACQSLMRLGFCHFVCFSGHLGPKQLTAIENAGKLVRRHARRKRLGAVFLGLSGVKPSLVSASSSLVTGKDVRKSPFWPDPEEHGGRRDTSVALALGKSWVSPNYKSLPKVEREDSRWKRNWLRRTKTMAGYWGSPAEADAALGEQELISKLEKVFPHLRTVWGGANPNRFFKSWYSIFPPNNSFFRAWLLTMGLTLVLAAWAYLTSFGIQVD